MALEISSQLHELVAWRRVAIETEVRAGHILDGLGPASKRLQRVKDAGSDATALSEWAKRAAILGTAEMDRRLAGRRAEGVDHVACQRQGDVVGGGGGRPVGK